MGHRVELLAPAGNPEGFRGALHAGADAVYLAGSRFGARAYAENFTTEELLECIRYAHILGRKVYLTVNTLVKETEFTDLYSCLSPLYDAGLDGVIVQDIGVLGYIRRHFPQLKLHASTQMTLTGGYGASLLRKMGVTRVVPARELSLTEIRALKAVSGLEVETFVHGAMCYCYSGQCLFSSILGGRSGNRGRCAQPCRLPYRVEYDGQKTEECYPLSLKDLCTIEHLPELIDAGIDSFKIEGRMKKPEYAAGVTAVYRRYIDLYYKKRAENEEKSWHIDEQDTALLTRLYLRSGQQDGYYFRHNSRDMVTLRNPSYSGNDEAGLDMIRERYLLPGPKRKIEIYADFAVGQPARISMRTEEENGPDASGAQIEVTVSGEVVSAAVRQPITEDNLCKQLGKLGDTLFEPARFKVNLDPDAFYSLKSINQLRRQAITLLEDRIIRENGFSLERIDRVPVTAPTDAADYLQGIPGAASSGKTDKTVHREIHVALREAAQLKVLNVWLRNHPATELAYRPARVYVDADLLSGTSSEVDLVIQQCQEIAACGCEVVLALPPIIRKRDEEYLEKLWKCYREKSGLFAGFLVRSMEGAGFLKEKGCEILYADAGFYVWNRETLKYIGDSGGNLGMKGFCLPYELNIGEQRRILRGAHIPCEKIIYGRIPLMYSANCVANTVDRCRKGEKPGIYYLKDRYQKSFPVLCNCEHCMNIIYNSLPLSLHRELHRWQNDVDFRLDFTVENGQEMVDILQYFMGGAEGTPPYKEYTTGHEKRGAE